MTEFEASEERHQETEVTLKCDIENLKRRLRRSETEIEDLERENKDLMIARNKLENAICRLSAKLNEATRVPLECNELKKESVMIQIHQDKITELTESNERLTAKIGELISGFAEKEKEWKQTEKLLKLDLASKLKEMVEAQLETEMVETQRETERAEAQRETERVEAQRETISVEAVDLTESKSGESSDSSNKRKLDETQDIQQSCPPLKKAKKKANSQPEGSTTNPHKFPPNTQIGPFGVPTVLSSQGVRFFLGKHQTSDTNIWTPDAPKQPQNWVFESYPGAAYLPRMDTARRRRYERQALEKLTLTDLVEYLEENSLNAQLGSRAAVLDKVKGHLNAMYDQE